MFGFEVNDLSSVVEHPFSSAELTLTGFFDSGKFAAGEERSVEERLVRSFFDGSSDFGSLNFVNNSLKFSLSRVLQTFAFGTAVEHHHIVVGDDFFSNVVELFERQFLANKLRNLEFGLRVEERFVLEEVLKNRLDKVGILASFGSSSLFFELADDFCCSAFVFAGGETESF